MNNTDLANFGLFMLSIIVFGIGSLFVGDVITDFDPDGRHWYRGLLGVS